MPIKSIIKLAQVTQHSCKVYEDKALGLSIGICNGTDIAQAIVAYAYDEFMTIIAGSLAVKNNKTGLVESITAGDSCVIPYDFDCQKYQQEQLRRFYVTYAQPQSSKKSLTDKVIYITENSEIPWQKTSDGHRKKVLYQSHNQGNDQHFLSGVWQSKPFVTGVINFPYHEFIFISSGSLICTDEAGIAHHFKKGDALYIPQGTPCSWQVQDKVSLHFTQIKMG